MSAATLTAKFLFVQIILSACLLPVSIAAGDADSCDAGEPAAGAALLQRSAGSSKTQLSEASELAQKAGRLDPCLGDYSTWNAGNGFCDSYVSGSRNHDNCRYDIDASDPATENYTAAQVCPECLECEEIEADRLLQVPALAQKSGKSAAATARRAASGASSEGEGATRNLPLCVGDYGPWNAGNGPCDSYMDGSRNQAFCSTDMYGGFSAAQVCPECGSCDLPEEDELEIPDFCYHGNPVWKHFRRGFKQFLQANILSTGATPHFCCDNIPTRVQRSSTCSTASDCIQPNCAQVHEYLYVQERTPWLAFLNYTSQTLQDCLSETVTADPWCSYTAPNVTFDQQAAQDFASSRETDLEKGAKAMIYRMAGKRTGKTFVEDLLAQTTTLDAMLHSKTA